MLFGFHVNLMKGGYRERENTQMRNKLLNERVGKEKRGEEKCGGDRQDKGTSKGIERKK